MPTPTKGPRLGGGPAHQRLILANLATSLFEHDSITTTEAKAKRLGGYTRITKIGARKGDNAPMAVIELVREPVAKKATVKEAEGATKRAAKDDAAKRKAAQDEAKAAAAATKADEDEAKAADTEEPTAVELPAGAVAATEDGATPEGFTVKGNADSGKYHVEGSQWYDQTIAEFWFADAEAAEAAGFEPAGGPAKQVEDEA